MKSLLFFTISIICLVIVVLLSGCASYAPPPSTPSGEPETTLENVDMACVRGVFLNRLIDQRWALKSNSDTQIVVEKVSGNLEANLFQARLGARSMDRLAVTFIALPGKKVRLITFEQIIANAGTGFEMATPLIQAQATQDGFAAFARAAAQQCP